MTKFFCYLPTIWLLPCLLLLSFSCHLQGVEGEPNQQNPQKWVLVVGGAGFIGSHVNALLQRCGYQTVVLDNLSRGNPKAVQKGIFIQGDIQNSALLDEIFTTYPIDAVMHFAAFTEVGESVTEPIMYYKNNVMATLNLLESMHKHRVHTFIFSSSAAIFGMPQEKLVTETHPCQPISPYGQTKLMVEEILRDLDHAYALKSCCLRYFNAAGGDPRGEIKNYKTKEANLIPILLRKLRNIEYNPNANECISIFGTDYPTPDGTGVRDYIHVEDLASAHIAAMERLFNGAPSCNYNLGNGQGFSVREVIAAATKVTGIEIKVMEGPRREGDPAFLIANSKKAMEELGWQPHYPELETIVEHAWQALH